MADEQTLVTAPTTTAEPTSLATTAPTAEPAKVDEAAKPAEPKPAEATKGEPLTDADIKFTEGFEVLPEAKTSFLEIANKHGFSKDAVGELIKLQESVAKSASEKGSADWSSLQETWQNESKADPLFAGEKLGPAVAQIGALIDEHGSPELRQVLDTTGAGNNVHVLRFFHKMASIFAEGKPLAGQPGAQSSLTTEQKLYPSMQKA